MNDLKKNLKIQKLNKKKKKTKKSKKKKKRSIPRKLFKPVMSNAEIALKEGNYFDESHYHTIIKKDFDAYGITETGEKILLFKLRKNCLTKNYVMKLLNQNRETQKKHGKRELP